MMFFASCTEEQIDDLLQQKPEIAFVQGEGLTATSTNVVVGTELSFQVKFAPNSGSESTLANFNFAITKDNGSTIVDVNPEFEYDKENLFDYTYTFAEAGNYIITATVTDADSKVNIATLNISCVNPTVEGLGTFAGNLNIQGHVKSNELVGYEVIDEDYTFDPTHVELVLGALEEAGRVSATFYIEETPVTLEGTKDGNTINFDEFHFFKNFEKVITVTLDLTIKNMTAVIDGDNLTLNGEAVGSGSTPIMIIGDYKIDMTGTIDGTLTKQVAE